jgi:prepilin-type processing-associated H-X9-DG protein
MGQNSLLSFSQISDGTAHTVAVAEVQSVADFSDNRGVWAFAAPGASLVGLDCDETCRGINDDPASDWIPYCAGVPGVLPCSFQNNKHSNAGPRSRHVGGAMLLFCDGSTRLVSDQIDIDVLVSQFTSMHGESLDQP